MPYTSTSRSIIAVGIAAVVCALAYWSSPKQVIQPVGILLPLSPAKSSIPSSDVSLYSTDNVPKNPYVVGTVTVSLHSLNFSTDDQSKVEQFGRQLAGEAGANGMIIKLFGHTMEGQVPSELAIYRLQGTAIDTHR